LEAGWLATVYDPIVAPLDWMGLRKWRQWAVGAARGRVLEIGVGTGLNLKHYRDDARVAAIDPDAASLQLALPRRNGAIVLHNSRAEELPFADESFDAVVGTLVFCTIADAPRALDEAKRVLKKGGALRLVEHVRVQHRLMGGLQDALTPAWKAIAGGCHLNRDTLAMVERAGFRVRAVHRKLGGLLIGIDASPPDPLS
jgi:ubiquinone/menaquinone biosynthesis C-methylase UbiE